MQSAMLRQCDSSQELDGLGERGAALERMQDAVQVLLRGVGEDIFREGLIDTPRRVAKAWLDMASGNGVECKGAFGTALFHEPIVGAAPDGLVIVRDITFAALSEESLLPFHGRCHIAYVPAGGVVLGLSKLARVTKVLAARVQSQQRLTADLAAAVQSEVRPLGVAVLVAADHLGAGPAPAPLRTSAVTGCFGDPAQGHLLQEVLLLLGAGGLPSAAAAAPGAEAGDPGSSSGGGGGCGSGAAALAGDGSSSSSGSMVAAVQTLLESVGESSTREGLKGSAQRYVRWLRSATAGYAMPPPPRGLASSLLDGGPRTPDDRSPDPSDASSDDLSTDMSTDLSPCLVHLREGRSNPEPEAEAEAGRGELRCRRLLEERPAAGAGAAAAAAANGAGAGISTAVLRFTSQCEHHLLPFYGTLRVAYTTPTTGGGGGGIAPSSEATAAALAHVVEMFSRRLQVQERLTQQVADAAAAVLGAEAVLVVCESAHMCMVARGVEKHASTTLTTAARGAWARDAAARAQPLQLLLSQQQ